MSAVDTAFHGLRQMIASGRLEAEQKFPPESELCEELGVSRGSLREAVRMLSALGVVESRHGSGTYVSQLRAEDIIGSMSLTVELLPLSSLLDMYELRRILESHAAAQAAAKLTPELGQALTELANTMEATTDHYELTRLDRAFHSTILKAAANPTLEALVEVFRTRSRSYQIFGLPDGPEIIRISHRGHRNILDAILARDPIAASMAAGAHVAQTESWLRQYQPSQGPDPLGSQD
ncbi:FadR/GntR family transcriptional regulator [Lysinibacter sp. HNR]|uniref:FadR/GntR family transcriptional regulator n=1 Tax=Lysinibacter sp. HNR TaxID=3031408 RepID=UPI0024355958|nr:FadR/GntR family transcriptional regulator [Lysinibacter sp. HNR]WGD37228.1 FadR/GntR family transcriptional regulator [Lysinibacter sp. HNR]